MKLTESDQEGTCGAVTSGICLMTPSQDVQLRMTTTLGHFSSSTAQTLQTTLITEFFVSGYLCSAVSFHYIMPSLMFRFSSPTFGLLHSSTGLYPAIDFPIESETWGAARHRRRPLFPSVRCDDDLSGGRVPASSSSLSSC